MRNEPKQTQPVVSEVEPFIVSLPALSKAEVPNLFFRIARDYKMTLEFFVRKRY
jgi:hypothetical protein